MPRMTTADVKRKANLFVEPGSYGSSLRHPIPSSPAYSRVNEQKQHRSPDERELSPTPPPRNSLRDADRENGNGEHEERGNDGSEVLLICWPYGGWVTVHGGEKRRQGRGLECRRWRDKKQLEGDLKPGADRRVARRARHLERHKSAANLWQHRRQPL
jgi:hypothetical protein